MSPREFRAVFDFLEEELPSGTEAGAPRQGSTRGALRGLLRLGAKKSSRGALPAGDMVYLKEFDDLFVKQGLSQPRERDPVA